MDAKSLFMYGLMASGALMVDADLRMAARPKNNYVVRQRNPVQFVSKTALYMEPSDFGYNGLKAQRNNNYDNFLRSNIDNEQDKRNFNTEAGRDMLPVRTYEAAKTDIGQASQVNKLPAGAAGTITATPGTPYVVPLRWNNPHSAELEVNVWIKDMTVVVPVKKPTCAGEGRQDAAFSFTIPTDFNTAIPARVPGFTGCKAVGDCVLQIYAHSVEPRQYAIGTPLIITGDVAANTATGAGNIEQARPDPGTDLSKQPNEICLSSVDPTANIANAVPRQARLISDVANHAYQNSDYSPYSGQQPEAISKNLQASVIIEMIPSNGGELGKTIRTGPQNTFAANLAAKVKKVVEANEAIVNKIIAAIGDTKMQNKAEIPAGTLGTQPTATTFRAAEVGSVTTKRLKTTTYIPALKVPADQIAAAKALVPAKYAGLVTDDGTVQLYQNVLNSLKSEFNKAAALGLPYYGPVIKTTAATLTDATQFKKINAAGARDGGKYAAAQFKATAAAQAAAKLTTFTLPTNNALLSALSADENYDVFEALTASGTERVIQTPDMDDMSAGDECDEDTDIADTAACDPLTRRRTAAFRQNTEDPESGLYALSAQEIADAQAAQTKSNTATATAASSIVAFAFSAVAAIFLA